MQNPLISVVVPAYNEEKYIRECLNSLVKQKFPKNKYEIVVVDNNSKDKTVQIVKTSFPAVKIIKEKKQGVVFARIAGTKEARGKIVAFLDADSYAPEDWLTKITSEYSKNKVVAVGGLIDIKPSTFSVQLTQNLLNRFYYPLYKIMPGANTSFLKSAYFDCGGYSPKANIGEEVYISKNLKKIGKLVIQKNNYVITSSRRNFSSEFFLFSMKYQLNLFAILFFNKPIFFALRPIRNKSFLSDFLR